MKKKLIGLSATLLAAVAIFFSTRVISNTNNISLASVIGLNDANAECVSTPINNGTCTFTKRCAGDPSGALDCDTTRSN